LKKSKTEINKIKKELLKLNVEGSNKGQSPLPSGRGLSGNI